ncbi:MAG: hypothetical protein WC208_15155, partial [Gallionella sp.]
MEKELDQYNDHALINLCIESLQSRLIISSKDKTGYYWNPNTLLWESITKQAVKVIIFQVVSPILTQKRVEYEALPVSKERTKLLNRLETRYNQIATSRGEGLGTAWSGLKYVCVNLRNDVLIKKMDQEFKVIPVADGYQYNLETGEKRLRTMTDYWSHEVDPTVFPVDGDGYLNPFKRSSPSEDPIITLEALRADREISVVQWLKHADTVHLKEKGDYLVHLCLNVEPFGYICKKGCDPFIDKDGRYCLVVNGYYDHGYRLLLMLMRCRTKYVV